MSPAHVLEPTYHAIKRRLMSGVWPSGYRLDTARLALEIGVSTSPVRDSLNRLAGEQMVDFEAGEGFHVPRLDAQRIRDLLDLNLGVLSIALQNKEFIVPGAIYTSTDRVERVSLVFTVLAENSDNQELVAVIAGLNDRLSALRQFDPMVLTRAAAEIDDLVQLFIAGSSAQAILEMLIRYHGDRKLAADKYVRLLARRRPEPS